MIILSTRGHMSSMSLRLLRETLWTKTLTHTHTHTDTIDQRSASHTNWRQNQNRSTGSLKRIVTTMDHQDRSRNNLNGSLPSPATSNTRPLTPRNACPRPGCPRPLKAKAPRNACDAASNVAKIANPIQTTQQPHKTRLLVRQNSEPSQTCPTPSSSPTS